MLWVPARLRTLKARALAHALAQKTTGRNEKWPSSGTWGSLWGKATCHLVLETQPQSPRQIKVQTSKSQAFWGRCGAIWPSTRLSSRAPVSHWGQTAPVGMAAGTSAAQQPQTLPVLRTPVPPDLFSGLLPTPMVQGDLPWCCLCLAELESEQRWRGGHQKLSPKHIHSLEST